MKGILIFIVCAILAAGGTMWYMKPSTLSPSDTVHTPLPSGVTFSIKDPPRESLSGTVMALSGAADIQSRIATEPAELTTSHTVQQGEIVYTRESGKVSIELKSCCMMTLSSQSSVSFVQTLPGHVVLSQPYGTVSYTTTEPIAIRSLHALMHIAGTVMVIVEPDDSSIQVKVTKGSLTAAFNDSENVTQRVTANAGQLFVFNDEERSATVK